MKLPYIIMVVYDAFDYGNTVIVIIHINMVMTGGSGERMVNFLATRT
jgi:hypothetical protein